MKESSNHLCVKSYLTSHIFVIFDVSGSCNDPQSSGYAIITWHNFNSGRQVNYNVLLEMIRHNFCVETPNWMESCKYFCVHHGNYLLQSGGWVWHIIFFDFSSILCVSATKQSDGQI